MTKTACLLVGLFVVIAAPAFGQAFTDVPADHWAYDAVNQLQKDGIVIGYPDGTFAGKRTLTRYEFAVAIARMADWVSGLGPDGVKGLTTEDVEKMLEPYAKTADIPDPANLANYVTKDDVAALRKLIDEFRDEIAALGVDVDALKRDVAALGARVDAIEAELKRVRITGEANIFAVSLSSTSPSGGQAVVNLDQRTAVRPNEAFLRNIGLVKDFDLKIAGRVSPNVTANATINYGNYLEYLGSVDDYAGGALPTSSADMFFPYYACIDATMGNGMFTVGRFPLQFTPYTLKKIDVDSYTSIMKTDDGNYPVDGAKLAWNFGGVDLALYAAKHDQNAYLANGLTALTYLHQGATGNAVGGLDGITQSAGVRASIALPWDGSLGVTYYQAWDRNGWVTNVVPGAGTWDQARVYGADLTMPMPFLETLSLTGSWTQSDTVAADTAPAAISDVDYLNTAWDAKLSANVASLSIAGGYKSIGRNFAAAGAWDKIGRWTNPTGVRGPYAEIALPIADNLKISLNGEFLRGGDSDFPYVGVGSWGADKDDQLTAAQAALKWGMTKASSLDLAYHWVKFEPEANVESAVEQYITVGLAHQFSPNAGLRIGYQFIDYDGGAGGPYGAEYRGSQSVVQFGVSF